MPPGHPLTSAGFQSICQSGQAQRRPQDRAHNSQKTIPQNERQIDPSPLRQANSRRLGQEAYPSPCIPKSHHYRATLAGKAECSGIGIHSGQPCMVVFLPAPIGQGIVFKGPQGQSIAAHWNHVSNTRLATTLSAAGAGTITMVEHLLAACYGLGISDLTIDVQGPEAPILDGGSTAYSQSLQAAGRAQSQQENTWAVITKPVTVHLDDRRTMICRPGTPMFEAEVDLDQGVTHRAEFDLHGDDFLRDIAPARTFSKLQDVKAMQAAGYIKGGSLDNALLLDAGAPVNPGGWHLPDECARHKILDMMGDFALLGKPIYGQLISKNGGHTLNYQTMQALESQNALMYVTTSQLPKGAAWTNDRKAPFSSLPAMGIPTRK
jgi:UDP-3-O-[3-hydroxymyristoyl] N-acetylglucosamine deacetylase